MKASFHCCCGNCWEPGFVPVIVCAVVVTSPNLQLPGFSYAHPGFESIVEFCFKGGNKGFPVRAPPVLQRGEFALCGTNVSTNGHRSIRKGGKVILQAAWLHPNATSFACVHLIQQVFATECDVEIPESYCLPVMGALTAQFMSAAVHYQNRRLQPAVMTVSYSLSCCCTSRSLTLCQDD